MNAVAGRIVCGVDDSSGGREALVVAEALSARLGLRLIAVTVASVDRVFPYGDAAQLERERNHAMTHADQLLDRITGSAGRGDGAERRVEHGRPAARLAAVAIEAGADLIVVGSRGRNRVSAALLGSVSRELIAQGPCPVLVVPPGAAGISKRRGRAAATSVVCGVDESPQADAVARQATRLARQLGDRLVLTHAVRPRHFQAPIAFTERRNARAWLEALAVALPPTAQPDLRVGRGDPANDLRRAADEENAELIVVGSPGRGPIPVLVSGSVAGDLASSAPVPVLVVNDGGWREVQAGPLESPTTTSAPTHAVR